MSEPGGFNRGASVTSFSSMISPVDPSRIQTLFNQATSKTSGPCLKSEREGGVDSLDRLLASLRDSRAQPDVASALGAGIFGNVIDYFAQGGTSPAMGNSGSTSSVLTFVDGLDFNYQLTDDDLFKVFARFGSILTISLSPDGSNGIVTFASSFQANRAASELNGKRLSGLGNGCLRVLPYSWGGMNASSASSVPLIRKYTCRFDIQIENDKDFHVARRIIGQKGCNMKRIVKQAGFDAKLRLRGRGSGFLEGSQKQESQEALHLCVSCKEYEGYKSAVDQVNELLEEIYQEYQQYCMIKGQPYPDHLRVLMYEHPLLYQPGALEVPLSPPLTPVESSPFDNMDIEHLIEARNEARRSCNFKEADRIREILKSRGIGLMDEPGGRGRGVEVTSWRVWR